jgi:hypothetical protein
MTIVTSILPPIASAIRDASHRKSHGDAMIHGPVAFAVPFIAACLFAVLRLLSIWSPRLDHYLWLLAVFVRRRYWLPSLRRPYNAPVHHVWNLHALSPYVCCNS